MNKRADLVWLAAALLLLGAAMLVMCETTDTVRAETQVEKVLVDPVNLTVSEPWGTDLFTLTLTSQPGATVVITLTRSSSECMVLPTVVRLDDINWATGVTATVSAEDDPIVDGSQICWIDTSKSQSEDPAFDGLSIRDVKVTVLDDDVAGAVVSPEFLAVSEPSGTEIFTITLTSQPTAVVSVTLASTDTGECEVTPGLVDLDETNWSEGVTATVTAVDDDIEDGPQRCVIQTGPAESGDTLYDGLDPADVEVTVLDDDGGGEIVVVPEALSVREPEGTRVFTVTLTSEPTEVVSVTLVSTDTEECDVTPGLVELDETNWSEGVTATVTAVDDDIVDGPQRCVIQTGPAESGDTGYDGLDPADVEVTVLDDDGGGEIVVVPEALSVREPGEARVFTVTLTSEPTDVVSVTLVSTDTGECEVTPGLVELDGTNWSEGVTATVTAVDDDIVDGPQRCVIQTGPAESGDTLYDGLDPADVEVTVLDEDERGMVVVPTELTLWEPSETALFTITLTSQPTDVVSVTLVSTDTEECDVAVGLVELNETNWSEGVAATVIVVDDDIDDGPQRCVIQTGPAESGDTLYDGLDPADVEVTVLDEDERGMVVVPTELTLWEPSETALFTITLTSEPTDVVSVTLVSTDTGECDVTVGLVELDGTNWSEGVTATVTAVDDDIDDGPQRCVIQTGPVVSGDTLYDGLDPADVEVTVLDEDERGMVVVPTELTLWEPSETALFTITLTSEPTDVVSVSLVSTDTGECDVTVGLVELNETNWSEGVAATVIVVDDDIDDGPQRCVIETGPVESGDTLYDGLDPADVEVTVLDEDERGMVVVPTELTLWEPSETALFTITLTSEPTDVVSVSLVSTDTGECDVTPGLVELNETNWSEGVAATVIVVDDDIDDGPQRCVIQTGPAESGDTLYDGLDPADVEVTVLDEDERGMVVVPTELTLWEPSETALFTITLTSEPTDAVSVTLVSTDTGECEVTPGLVELDGTNWSEGVMATVTAVDDDIDDGPQRCVIQTGPAESGDTLYDGLDPADVEVTVLDEDERGMVVVPTELTLWEPSETALFTIALTSQPTDVVSVSLVSTDTGECEVTPGLVELDGTNWSEGVAATVIVVDDDIDDGPQRCVIQTGPAESGDTLYDGLDPADVEVTVLDEDERGMVVVPTELTLWEPSETALFTITLTSEPTDAVSVSLVSTDTDECDVTVGLVELNETNWSEGVAATVIIVDDDIDDGPQRCVIQTGPAESGDTLYDGLDPADVEVTVLDEDERGMVVVPTELTLWEPSETALFTITLTSEPTEVVSVTLVSTDTGECEVTPGLVELDGTNWSEGVMATVTAVDDDIDDGPRRCVIQTGPAESGDTLYDGLDPADVEVTVLDEDERGMVVVPTELSVREPGEARVFTVTLTSEPTAVVFVTLVSTDTGECEVTPWLKLDGTNWSEGVTATVVAVDDDLVDGPQRCVIETGPAVSGDTGYDGLDPADVDVTVLDDETVTYVVHMPLVVRRWPPVPDPPALAPIENQDGDGTYSISWSSVSGAVLYILEESSDATFSDAREISVDSTTSYGVTQRGAGRYYYRVKARNQWSDSVWSTVRSVDVLWEAEPNDHALTQANGPLVSGLTYYGTFPSEFDLQDYYYFDLLVPQTVELWLTNIPEGHNYDLILRDADLGDKGYSGELGNASEHILTGLLPAGRYYIQVFHRSEGGSSQAYELLTLYD